MSVSDPKVTKKTKKKKIRRPDNEPSWPIRLFRQVDGIWERVEPRSNNKRVPIFVGIRESALIVHRLHIRLRTHASTLVRRGTRVLVSTPQALYPVVVLQFRTEQNCSDFLDEWYRVNPRPVVTEEPPPALQEKSEQVSNYLFQMMLDPSFPDFCKRLEESLQESPDGQAVLDALRE